MFHSQETDLQQQMQKLADFQWISAVILAGRMTSFAFLTQPHFDIEHWW